ncbi:MAG: ATP-dependent Clp protease ATP-binding subunit [Acidobacteria bacterium]|nr:MAG: ATP-dependent Clp protease ATP-binding subunit [Acidobacteriota bacterium]
MKTGCQELLDPTLRCDDVCQFESALRRKIVGQNQAVGCVVDLYQTFLAGLHPPGRPIANLLLLGPTGSGKTRVVEAIAETLFGDARAVIKVDCAEFQHSHEIAKLIGSPPGYLGHRETHPLLTQEALGQWHTDRLRLSLLLFDEIEKASDALWQLLLGILDKATLTLGDNRRVDFTQTIIFMTSNLGAAEMDTLTLGGTGFMPPQIGHDARFDARLDAQVDRVAVAAARHKFSPEFMNRIDRTVVFHTLRPEELGAILDIELGMVQQRILASSGNHPFLFNCTQEAKDWLLHEGYDPRYGARHLKRAIERHVVFPLAKLIATGQVRLGDVVRVDYSAEQQAMTFVREAEGMTTMYRPSPPTPMAASMARGAARGARRFEFPMAMDGK